MPLVFTEHRKKKGQEEGRNDGGSGFQCFYITPRCSSSSSATEHLKANKNYVQLCSVVRHVVDMTPEVQVRTDYFGLTGEVLDFQPS